MSNHYKTVKITLSPNIVAKLAVIGQRKSRSVQGTIRSVLWQYVANQENKAGKIVIEKPKPRQ